MVTAVCTAYMEHVRKCQTVFASSLLNLLYSAFRQLFNSLYCLLNFLHAFSSVNAHVLQQSLYTYVYEKEKNRRLHYVVIIIVEIFIQQRNGFIRPFMWFDNATIYLSYSVFYNLIYHSDCSGEYRDNNVNACISLVQCLQ